MAAANNKTRIWAGWARRESGQSLLEFALVAPIVMLLMVGSIEIGRILYMTILVNNAARAGAQYGAQNLATAADENGMQNAALADGQNIAGLNANATHFCSCADGSSSTCQPTDCSASHRLVYVQ